MRKAVSALLVFIYLFDIAGLNNAFALVAGSSASQGNPASAQMGTLAESAGSAKSFQPDLFTGRAQTGIPIFTPPGRKGVQPALGLSYSSSGGNGWLGVGWALDMGFIQRDVKKGVPKYNAEDKYIFSFQGVSSELVSVASNEYRARDEALFLKFIFDPASNFWTVTDKSGTRYSFGLMSECRQTNNLGTFKWAISKVEDVSGNFMEVHHSQDGGELYLASVEYNGNSGQNFAATHKVEFVLEERPDKSLSYMSGGRVEFNKRLKEILIKVKDAQGEYQLARQYALGYEVSPATQRSRLRQVTEYGKDGTTSLPPLTFTYQDKPLQFDSMADFSGIQRPSGLGPDYDFPRTVNSSGSVLTDMMDINGDGKNDRVMAVSGNTAWKVQLNQENSFGAAQDFGTLYKPGSLGIYDWVSQSEQDASNGTRQVTDMLDINGDGLPDRIIAQGGNASWIVQLNTGTGFGAANSAWGPIERNVAADSRDYIRYVSGSNETAVEFMDMNGDGLPDRIQAFDGNTNWKVQWNTGSGFASMQDFGPIERMTDFSRRDYIRYVSDGHETTTDLADLNGDGLPDRIQATDGNLYWKVQWNTGSGFTSMEDYGPIQVMDSTSKRYYIRHYSDAGEQKTDLFDINGDGLPDRVQSADANTVWKVQYNTGSGFGALQDFGPVENMTGSVRYYFTRWTDVSGQIAVDMADVNGDGMPDRVQAAVGNTAWKVQANQGPHPDLLKIVENGRGGKTTLVYSVSTSLDNKDSNGVERLPFPVQVVSRVTQEDGMGNSVVTDYSYQGGLFDGAEREFRGFREVTVTDAAGTKTINTFGQDDHNKGRLLIKEV